MMIIEICTFELMCEFGPGTCSWSCLWDVLHVNRRVSRRRPAPRNRLEILSTGVLNNV